MAWVKRRFDQQREARSLLERQWRINTAFVRGQQWYQWDTSKWTLVPEPTGGRRHVREQRNFIRPHVRREIAMLTGFTPAFKVRPASRDFEDQQAAVVGTRVAQGYWGQLNMNLLAQRLAAIAVTKGTAFMKCGWDPTAGKNIEGFAIDPESGEVIVRDDTGDPEPALYAEGDFYTAILPPDNIYVDPHATSDEDSEWMMEMTNVPIESIEREFPRRRASFRMSSRPHREAFAPITSTTVGDLCPPPSSKPKAG